MSPSNPTCSYLLATGLALALGTSSMAPPGHAGELVPAIGTELGWDSNNDGETQGEKGTVRTRTTPEISIREEIGRLALNASARIAYDASLDFDDLDDFFDEFADVGLQWQASSRTSFSAANQFARVENIDRAIAIDGFALEEIPDTENEQTRTIRNRASVGVLHRLTSRWTARAGATYLIREYNSDSRFDQDSLSGDASLNYAWNARTTVGIGGRFSYDSYEPTPFQRGVRARYYQSFASLGYLIAPDLKMSMSVGPAWVQQETKPGALSFRTYPFVTSYRDPVTGQNITPVDLGKDPSEPFAFLLNANTCASVDGFRVSDCLVQGFPTSNPPVPAMLPPVPVLITNANNPIVEAASQLGGSSNDTSGLDIFASFSLVKSWEWGDVSLAYNRRETSSGGVGTGATADSISLFTSGYEPAPLWKLSGLFNWTQREASGNVPRDLAAVTLTNLLVDENGLINGPGTLVPVANVAIADQGGFVTDGSFDRADDVSSYFLSLRAERRVSRNLVAFGTWSWRHDDRSGQLQSDSTLDVFRIFVGARYTFDPVPF